MATSYKTPGVHLEEIPKFPPSIAPVDTAIPAFIGYTERAVSRDGSDLTLVPKRIESLVEYEQHFGGPELETKITVTIETTTTATAGAPVGVAATAAIDEQTRSKHILYYAMQLFYANGGKSCYIVSVGPYLGSVGAELDGVDLGSGLEPLSMVDEPTLIVVPEAQSLTVAADFGTLQNSCLAQCEDLKDRFVIMDVHGGLESMSDPGADFLAAAAAFRSTGPNDNLKYGAAYAPNLETTLDYQYDPTRVMVTEVLDTVASPSVALDSLTSNQTSQRAKAAIRALPLTMPPSAAIAGIYAAVDAKRGVWKAPANVGLNAVVKPTIQYTNTTNDVLNVDVTAGKSINAIRPFVGKGTLVWGARTLAGNDNEWRYVSVRRFFIFVEESTKKATEQFTFEPNDANTWVKVQAMIENFLTTQWRAGALQGIKPEHAFYVAVGLGKTMTALDILEGRMVVEIGMAAVRPAEFLILRFSHKLAES
ncbi:phage tail sheath C-terminal domain-containing protein [Cellulomonas sp. URHE0023]|uniref:phage tail sheath family protein n=1 Tax=Cellulomonas sp. URHE0023 TaxID=1380354 RepID=UPI000486A2E7|nr:phage tail sheath C-terminal domain-containing protein [Cellulomonas sp. URHE0023]